MHPVISQSKVNRKEGIFLLHKFEQRIGKEKYTIRQSDSGLTYFIDFKFVDKGSAVPLKAVIQVGPGFKPQRLAIKGKTSRFSSINDSIEIVGDKAYTREGDC